MIAVHLLVDGDRLFGNQPGQEGQIDCQACQHDDELRRRNGCDQDLAEDQCLAILQPCPWCGSGSPACSLCHGKGEVPVLRCPWQTVSHEHLECVRAYMRTEQGVLPATGGWNDQAATFADACKLVGVEIGRRRESEWKRHQPKGG